MIERKEFESRMGEGSMLDQRQKDDIIVLLLDIRDLLKEHAPDE